MSMPALRTSNFNHADVPHEFREYIESYIKRHDCYGLDAVGAKQEFVPREALETFWGRDGVIDVLCSADERVRSDPRIILEDYLVVFSILVWIGMPSGITVFTNSSLDDRRVPIEGNPDTWLDVPGNLKMLNEFKHYQYKFSPFVFETNRRFNAQLSPDHIIPVRNKELLDKDADEDDDVQLYKAEVHPACQGDLPSTTIVLKEYIGDNPETKAMYENELDIYVNQGKEALEYIVGYYGSFEQQGKRTIALEHANGGDLANFFRSNVSFTKEEDRHHFWTSFFGLLLGLAATHDMNPRSHGQKTGWLLKGIHQDIRPQNILVFKDPGSAYNVRFKLTDFGTGHVRKVRVHGFDRLGSQRIGNGMYSAPEAYRDDNIPKPQLCECDVWSLGGVGSEALVWSISGDSERSEYQKKRALATGKTNLKGGYHEGCFHNGDTRLDVVKEVHDWALLHKSPSDNISALVSDIILHCMLEPNPKERFGARQTFDEWEDCRQNLPVSGATPSRNQSSASMRTAGFMRRTTQSQRQGSNSTYGSHTREPPNTRYQEPWLTSPDPQFTTLSGEFPSQVRFDAAPHQALSRLSMGSDLMDHNRRTRPERVRSEDDYTGRPDTVAEEDRPRVYPESQLSGGVAGSRASVRSLPEVHNSHRRDVSGSSQNGAPAQRLQSTFSWGRTTVDEHLGIQEEEDLPENSQETDLGIQFDTNTAGYNQRSPERASGASPPVYEADDAPIPSDRRSTMLTVPGTRSFPTVDIIWIDYIKPKDNQKLPRFGKFIRSAGGSSLSRDHELLRNYPQISKALTKLKGYGGRDQIFIVDDGASMYHHRDDMGKTVRVLAWLTKLGKVDPNKNIDLYFVGSPDKKRTVRDSKPLQEAIEKHEYSRDDTQISSGLNDIIDLVLRGGNPVSIYVLTDGRWNHSSPGTENDLCQVDKVVERLVIDVKNKNKNSNWVGIQFIRFFGKFQNPQDEVGRKRLEYLDDELKTHFERLGVQKSDIVDTQDWNGDVCDMLLGSIFAENDDP